MDYDPDRVLPNRPKTVEDLIDAATHHGLSCEPDGEVGDLQDFLRVAVTLMTPDLRKLFLSDPSVLETYESARDT